MTHAVSCAVRRDAEPAHADDHAILNMFQVMAINLLCFLAMTVTALLLGISWWLAVLVGWVGSSVATLPVTALVILLWPVASEVRPSHADEDCAAEVDATAHMAMWHRDLEEEFDAAFASTAQLEVDVSAAQDRKANGCVARARDLSAERRAA